MKWCLRSILALKMPGVSHQKGETSPRTVCRWNGLPMSPGNEEWSSRGKTESCAVCKRGGWSGNVTNRSRLGWRSWGRWGDLCRAAPLENKQFSKCTMSFKCVDTLQFENRVRHLEMYIDMSKRGMEIGQSNLMCKVIFIFKEDHKNQFTEARRLRWNWKKQNN